MGWAKYYEDNVRIAEERLFAKDTGLAVYSAPSKPIKKYACPFCGDRFELYSELCHHMIQHAKSQAFFVINGKILSGEIYVDHIYDVKMMNYRDGRVKGTIVINGSTELAATVLDEHNRIADLTGMLKQYVVKSVELILEADSVCESFLITQNLDILAASKAEIIDNKYCSNFFYDEVSEGSFGLPQYRVFLSILAHERNLEDASMLFDKISSTFASISNSQEEILDYVLYNALLTGITNEQTISDYCSEKNKYAYLELLALLNYDMANVAKYATLGGKENSDFQIGCSLIRSYLEANEVDIHFFENKYHGQGVLKEIICFIHLILHSDFESFKDDGKGLYASLEPLQQFPLIKDICNVYVAYNDGGVLSERTYKFFSRLSPVVCAIKAEQTLDDSLRVKILKSAIKRFETCEWFFIYASAYFDNDWANSRITKSMPNLYWKEVNTLNSQLEVPFTNDFLAYLKKTQDIRMTAIGSPSAVGCSCFIISSGGFNIMLDCGIRPGVTDESAYPNFDNWKEDIDAIIISHAHIDHSGAIARAHSIWPNAIIITTPGTKAFLEPLLHDMSIDGTTQDELESIPIEKNVAYDTYNSIVTIGYSEWITIANNIKIKLHPAGHLFGAAIVELEIWNTKVVYTGDFCMHEQEMCSGAKLYELPREPDLLISEATYYLDLKDRNWLNQRDKLREGIKSSLQSNHTVLLPSTAFGRSQEVLCILADMLRNGELSMTTPIYIGGFACKTCAAIESQLNKAYSEILERSIALEPGVDIKRGSIIIASSGTMRRKTASYKIAESINRRNKKELVILNCGSQDDDSWMLNNIYMNDSESFPLSAHANRSDINYLISYLQPRTLALVHWGTNDGLSQAKQIDEIQKTHRGNMQVLMLKDSSITSITDIKNLLKKES